MGERLMRDAAKDACVLVAAHNEEVFLDRSLTSAVAQGVPLYVVDDASTDLTSHIAAYYAGGERVLSLTENVGKAGALQISGHPCVRARGKCQRP